MNTSIPDNSDFNSNVAKKERKRKPILSVVTVAKKARLEYFLEKPELGSIEYFLGYNLIEIQIFLLFNYVVTSSHSLLSKLVK